MHWILIGIGLIILRITEPMFGMFLSEISWFVFSGLFIYLGFALHSLQVATRELQVRQRELLLELKRVSKRTVRAVQALELEHRDDTAAWFEATSPSPHADIVNSLNEDEWEDWLPTEEIEVTHNSTSPSPSHPHHNE